jgi:hypothetical protein
MKKRRPLCDESGLVNLQILIKFSKNKILHTWAEVLELSHIV